MNQLLPNQFFIRSYQPTDYPQVKTLLQEAGLFDEAMDAQIHLDQKIKTFPGSILIASSAKQIVGCLIIVADFGPFLFRLAVKKPFRRQGLGTKLLTTAETHLRQHHHREAILFVAYKNQDLINFYKKRGYQLGHVFRGMYKEL